MTQDASDASETDGLLTVKGIQSYGAAPITCDDSTITEPAGAVQNHIAVSKLPVRQLLLIFAMRLAEPIAYNQVIPYINNANDGPRWSHRETFRPVTTPESSFAAAELLTVIQWGRLSDHIGRKPVLMLGLTGTMLSIVVFGFSKSFVWALIGRALAGALSGNVAVLLSAIGDLTDETNEATAFASMGLAANVATISGFFIGGAFAEPALGFPDSLGHYRLLKDFPYLLPCLISAIIILTSGSLGAIFFCETLPRRIVDWRKGQDDRPLSSANQSTRQIAVSPQLLSVLIPFFLLSILNTASLVVFALFAYTPIDTGGLGLSIAKTGSAIACSGLAGTFAQILILPRLQRRCSTITLYKRLMAMWPIIYLSFPLLNLWARMGATGGIALWIPTVALLSANRLAAMSYSLNLILTKNAAPSATVLGTVFAISQGVNCVARSVAPAFVSALFALSKERHILSGNLVWYTMFFTSLLGVWATARVKVGSLRI